MEIGRSDSIRVSLVRILSTIEIAGRTVIAATPIPVGGTPETPIKGGFGPEYEAFAIANLHAAAFDVSPSETEYQSLEQPRTEWKWSITPKELKSNWQSVLLDIKVQWKPVGSDGQPIGPYEIWSEEFKIYVDKSLIATGQLNAFNLVSALVGSVLSIPWLYEKIKERKEKRQKDEEGKPKILLP